MAVLERLEVPIYQGGDQEIMGRNTLKDNLIELMEFIAGNPGLPVEIYISWEVVGDDGYRYWRAESMSWKKEEKLEIDDFVLSGEEIEDYLLKNELCEKKDVEKKKKELGAEMTISVFFD